MASLNIEQLFLGNSIESYVWFIAILLFGIVFRKIISKGISRLGYSLVRKQSKSIGAEKFLDLLNKPVSLFVFLIILYLAFDRLEFPYEWNLRPVEQFGLRMVLFRTFQSIMIISFTWIIYRLVDYFCLVLADRHIKAHAENQLHLIPFLREAIKIFTAILSAFFILSAVYNVNVTSLIAGLGIGGLAIALAAKETLENLLGSFTIFFDKPFAVGDNVKAGTIEGTVLSVGFRSTRLMTPDKSIMTVPNKKLVDTELENISLKGQNRARFTISLSRTASSDQIKLIVSDIKTLLVDHAGIENDAQVRFLEIGISSFDIFIQYFVKTGNWAEFIKVKEEINLEILGIVAKHNAELAFPSSSVYIEKN